MRVILGAVSLVAAAVIIDRIRVLSSPGFPSGWKVPLGEWLDSAATWLLGAAPWVFTTVRAVVGGSVETAEDVLLFAPWPAVGILAVAAAYRLAGPGTAVLAVVGIAFPLGTGLWIPMLESLALMAVAILFAAAFGVAIGIAAALNERIATAIRPVLDAMQVTPIFAYLLPVMVAFGTGAVPSVVVTVIYAMPPTIRLTNLGIREIDREPLEAARVYGASPALILRKVQLPLAKPSIVLGINQTIMLSLSMVIVAALIGAGGLGEVIWRSLIGLEVGRALEAGITVVLLAALLDRITYGASHGRARGAHRLRTRAAFAALVFRGRSNRESKPAIARTGALDSPWGWAVVATVVALIVAVSQFQESLRSLPEPIFSLEASADAAIDWINGTLGFLITPVRTFIHVDVLVPSMNAVTSIPWPVMVLGVAAAGLAAGGVRLALPIAAGVIAIGLIGTWDATAVTATLVLISTSISVIVGVPLGMVMSVSGAVDRVIRPVLDTMQTMHMFVYLVPAVMLLGIGPVAGIFATVIYATPPLVRLTNLGLRSVSPEISEAGEVFGATRLQSLVKLRLPLALPSVMAGLTQTVLLSIVMIMAAALIGTPGLGETLLRAFGGADLPTGFNVAIAAVILAMILDRILQGCNDRWLRPGRA